MSKVKIPLKADLGLLVLRAGSGCLMFFGHGLGKLLAYTENYERFPDPLGVGSPISMALAVFAEAICSALLVLGYKTRLAVIPLITTMLVAALIVHSDDPWGKKEMAVLYALPFITLLFTGGGRYTVERLFLRR